MPISKIRETGRIRLCTGRLVPHRIVLTLIATAILLPITICVVFGVAGLLQAMGDSVGGAVLHRIALGGGILWGST